MARAKLISDEALIQCFDEYFIETCKGNTSCIKFSDLEKYVKNKYEGVTARLIRRNAALRAHINELEVKEKEKGHPVLAFKDIDVDTVCRKSTNVNYLREFLSEMNQRYKSVYESAQMIYQENKKLKKQVEKLKTEKDENVQRAEELVEAKKEGRNELKALRNENKALRDLVDTYVYPEIANALLKEKGLLKGGSDIIDADILNENLITAGGRLDTPVKKAPQKKQVPKEEVKSGVIIDLSKRWED